VAQIESAEHVMQIVVAVAHCAGCTGRRGDPVASVVKAVLIRAWSWAD
jgi:hypothetical protein